VAYLVKEDILQFCMANSLPAPLPNLPPSYLAFGAAVVVLLSGPSVVFLRFFFVLSQLLFVVL
jgi:hypothetical protein